MSSELDWFKSSYSAGDGGECVEVAFDWRTSSHSTGDGGDCVEISACPHTIHIRDSKRPTHPSLTLPPVAWSAFLRELG